MSGRRMAGLSYFQRMLVGVIVLFTVGWACMASVLACAAHDWVCQPVAAMPAIPLLPDNYYLEATLALVWQDSEGTFTCSGTYTERAVTPDGGTQTDDAIWVESAEYWDECPVRETRSARVRVDRLSGQWLEGGTTITERWGWEPAVTPAPSTSAFFEINTGSPLPVSVRRANAGRLQTHVAYDENGLWVWALRREEITGGDAAAVVWEAWVIATTSRSIRPTAGVALPAQHAAWWTNRLWLGPYTLPEEVFAAFQTFTGGQMLWLASDGTISVLRDLDSTYRTYTDTWVEDAPICTGAARLDPPVVRGFGNAWCENVDGFARSIGIPRELEWGKDVPTLPCTGGRIVRKDVDGDIVMLPHGTWTMVK